MTHIAVKFYLSQAEPEHTGILSSLLDEKGFEGTFEQDSALTAYINKETFSKEIPEEIKSTLQRSGCRISYEIEEIPDQNWNQIWEKSFDPVLIENLCAIRAPFHPEFPEFRYQITIEPKMSFGTGHHFTTRLMIEKMLTLSFENERVLDMGCGTGVLAILASMQGAREVVAIDIDDWAFKNTLENIHRNERGNIRVLQGSSEIIPRGKFGIILANINRNILLEQLEIYSDSCDSRGVLLLSGILTDDVEVMKETAKKHGFNILEERTLEKWVMIFFKRN